MRAEPAPEVLNNLLDRAAADVARWISRERRSMTVCHSASASASQGSSRLAMG